MSEHLHWVGSHLTLAAFIFLLVVLIVVRLLASTHAWEITTGWSTLAMVAVSILAAATVASLDWWPWIRLLAVVSVLTVAVLAASSQWTRAPLRCIGAFGLLLVGLMVISLGQEHAAARSAEAGLAELAKISKAVAALELPAGIRPAELKEAKKEALEQLDKSIGEFGDNPPAYVVAAKQLRIALSATDASARTTARAQFAGAYPPSPLTRAAEKLEMAVDGAEAAVAAAEAVIPTAASVLKAVDQACLTARASGATGSVPECSGEPNGEELAVQMAVARLRLAQFRQGVLGRAEDVTAIKEADAALTSARADVATANSTPLTVVQALEAGGNVLFDEVFPGEPPVDIGWLGWLLLAGIALLAWRGVERRSGRQEPGPVTITFKAFATKENEAAGPEAEAAFRTALLTNVAEPAAAPGATRSSPVSDLVELAAGSTEWLKTVVSALKSIFNEPYGYQTFADVVAPQFDGDTWRVLVRINSVSGGQVAVKTVPGKDAIAASRAAGFWAAGTVLQRSTRVPSWACWSGDVSEALARYEQAATGDIRELERAVAQAPTSGLLLHKLADSYDLESRHSQALGLYSRAVSAHPQYLTARYRMAVSVTMLSLDPDHHWFTEPISERLRIGHEVLRACQQIGVEAPSPAKLADPTGGQKELADLAGSLYDQLIHDLSTTSQLVRLLRRSERASVSRSLKDLADPYGARKRGLWMAMSAKLAVTRVPPPAGGTPVAPALEETSGLKEAEKQADDGRSFWQLSYNLACFYARKSAETGDTDSAVTWLETALARPGSGQMAGSWLETDPDLVSLHQLPRFKTLVAELNPKPEVDSNG